MASCLFLTPAQLNALLQQGYQLLGGPYLDQGTCVANCGVVSSPSSTSSAGGPFWCVTYYAENGAGCPTSGSACIAQSALTSVFGDPLQPGTFVELNNGCFGEITGGPYTDAATCASHCGSSSAAASPQSVSSQLAQFWCVLPVIGGPTCPTLPTCFATGQLAILPGQGTTIKVGTRVGFGVGGNPCLGIVTAGPFTDSTTCAANCGSSVSSKGGGGQSSSTSSVSEGGGQQTLCCPGITIPNTLHLSIAPFPVGCPNLNGKTAVLTFQGIIAGVYTWSGTDNSTCAITWTLTCSGNAWGLSNNDGWQTTTATPNCNPIQLVFNGSDVGSSCPGCDSQGLTVTIIP